MEHRISLAGACLLLLAAVLATRVTVSVGSAAPAVAQSPSALLPLQRQKKSLQEDLALLLAESLPEQTSAAAEETTVFRERERRRSPPHERRQMAKKDPRHAGVKTFPSNREGSFFSERLHQMDAAMAADDDDGRRRRQRHQRLLKKRTRAPNDGGHSSFSQNRWNPYFPALDDVSVDRRVTRYGEHIFPVNLPDTSSSQGAYADDRVDLEAAAIEAALRRMTWEQFVRWIIDRQERNRDGKDDYDTRPRSVIKRSPSTAHGNFVSPDRVAAMLADDDDTAKVKRSKSSTATATTTTKVAKIAASPAEQQRSAAKDKSASATKSATAPTTKSQEDATANKKKKTKTAPPARAAVSGERHAASGFKDRKWVPQDAEHTLRSKKSWDEYIGVDKRSAAPPSKRRLPADVDIGSYLSAGNRYKGEVESYHGNDKYQSDEGYQSDGGYQSDDGYQSDGGYHGNDGYQSDGGYHSNDGYQSDSGIDVTAPDVDPTEQELKDYLVKWYFQKMLHSVGGRIDAPDYLPDYFFRVAGIPDPRDTYTFVAPDDDEEEDDRKKRAPHRLMASSTVPESDPDDVNPPLRVVEERLRKLEDVILLSATRLLEKELDARSGSAGTGAGAPDATESDVVDHLKAAFGLEKVRDALVEFREAFNKIRLKEDLTMLSRSEADDDDDDWRKKKLKKRRDPVEQHSHHPHMAPVPDKKSGEPEKVEPLVRPSGQATEKTQTSLHDNGPATKPSDDHTSKEVSKIVHPANTIESEVSSVPCPVVSDAVEYCRELGDALGEVGHLFARQCVEHMLCFTCDPSPNVCDELFLREAGSLCGDDFRCQAIAGAMRSVFLSNRDEFRDGHSALCRTDRCVDKLRRHK